MGHPKTLMSYLDTFMGSKSLENIAAINIITSALTQHLNNKEHPMYIVPVNQVLISNIGNNVSTTFYAVL